MHSDPVQKPQAAKLLALSAAAEPRTALVLQPRGQVVHLAYANVQQVWPNEREVCYDSWDCIAKYMCRVECHSIIKYLYRYTVQQQRLIARHLQLSAY